MADAATAPQEESKSNTAEFNGSESLLKSIGTAATVILAALYGIGLLVTNAYLLSIGVLDFNLFRSRCVLTGAWAAPLLFSMCLPAALMMGVLTREKKKKGETWIIIALCALTAMFTWILGLSIGLVPNVRLALYYLGGVGVFLTPASSYALLYFVKKHDKRPNLKPGPPSPMLFYVLMLVCFVGVSAGVGKYAYPAVSAAFGGGKPQRAKLVLNHEGVTVWKTLPGIVDYDELAKKFGAVASVPSPDPMLTPEVEILYENESQLVVRWNSKELGSVVMLDRKLVSAVIPTERQL